MQTRRWIAAPTVRFRPSLFYKRRSSDGRMLYVFNPDEVDTDTVTERDGYRVIYPPVAVT